MSINIRLIFVITFHKICFYRHEKVVIINFQLQGNRLVCYINLISFFVFSKVKVY